MDIDVGRVLGARWGARCLQAQTRPGDEKSGVTGTGHMLYPPLGTRDPEHGERNSSDLGDRQAGESSVGFSSLCFLYPLQRYSISVSLKY